MKILGIGESVIDNVYLQSTARDSSEVPLPERHIGGPILIAMILLSRFGIDTTFLTTLGKDNDARFIKNTLEHERVSVRSKSQEKTKSNTIFVNKRNGVRTKIHEHISHTIVKNLDRKFLHQFDLILIDRHQPQAFYELLEKKKPSTLLLIDPSTEISTLTRDMIRYADYPIIPIEAVQLLGNGKSFFNGLQEAFQLARKPIIVTLGEQGSLLYDGKVTQILPAVAIKAIDTTGAGDIYRGGFAYGIAKSWIQTRCANFANLVAGLHCTRIGNAAAIPTKQEIQLQEHLPRRQYVTIPEYV